MSSTEQTGKVEQARQREARQVSRRSFLRVSTFAGLTLFVGAMTAGFLGFFNLRSPKGFGRPVTVPKYKYQSQEENLYVFQRGDFGS